MSTTLLMPKATAVWLVDSTSLSFEQIAAFCGLHPLEVQGVADGDVAGGIMGVNPIQNGQLTREEIEKAEADPTYRMKVSDPKVRVAAATKRKGPRYTPISRRNERPNAIRWLLRNHPELKDAQIMRLVGTTKSTIDSVRDNTHWNSTNIQPMDPVTLGLCSQIDLDLEVKRAAAKSGIATPDEADTGTMLLTAEEAMATSGGRTGATDLPGPDEARRPEHSEELDADSVFAKLKSLKNDSADRD
ncbi:MAG: cell cycle transcriptional regulator TrcR [Devosia sp.]